MKFSLIHPSRSRPQKSLHTITKWAERAHSDDFEVIISIDDDDPMQSDYMDCGNTILMGRNNSAVDAINNAAKIAQGDIIIIVSDDTDCPENWHGILSKATSGLDDFVLKVYDGIQKWIVTMPIIDRAYYNRFGYVYHPEYRHMFCDTDFTHTAELLNRVIWRNDITFSHLHYSVAKSSRDEINERADATWNEGKSLYLKRFRKNFGLENVNPWNISNDNHIQWLKKCLK
jgi:hypothetical protein